ncbi:MAG: hypothetical protein ABIN01_20740 [Ferruginibacter sp.]
MVEEIFDNDVLLAIIIRSDFKKDGIQFFTPSHFSQQLGYMNRSKGYKIDAHSHRLVERKVSVTQEVLIVRSGSLRIELFDSKQNFIKEVVLTTGDTILLASGGHAIEMLEDTELIEVKQGPYTSDDDKLKFTSYS